MTADPRIAYTLADGSISAADLPEPMQVWWGMHQGALLGVMTEQVGPTPDDVDPREFIPLCRGGAATKSLGHDEVWPFVSSTRPDLQRVSDELVAATWNPATIIVDGEPDEAYTIRYHGLDFVVGRATSRAPYLLIRPAGHDAPWPALVTVRL